MVFRILMLAAAILIFAPTSAFAKSCSEFALIQSYDEAAHTVKLKFKKSSQRKFFPRPDTGGTTPSKMPSKCKGKVKKQGTYPVKETGGRMSVTQIRMNFMGKMLNDTDDATWFKPQIEKLVADKTLVAVIIRPGMDKDKTLELTTIYLPIDEEELKEIERMESEVVDD
jgi:hypothetical protein